MNIIQTAVKSYQHIQSRVLWIRIVFKHMVLRVNWTLVNVQVIITGMVLFVFIVSTMAWVVVGINVYQIGNCHVLIIYAIVQTLISKQMLFLTLFKSCFKISGPYVAVHLTSANHVAFYQIWPYKIINDQIIDRLSLYSFGNDFSIRKTRIETLAIKITLNSTQYFHWSILYLDKNVCK